MATTFQKIATVDVGSGGASSIAFTSIPSTYNDLCIKLSLRTTIASNKDDMRITFNGTTTTYSLTYLQGSGSASSGSRVSGFNYLFDQNANNGNTSAANTFSNIEFYIPNYAGSAQKPLGWYRAYEDTTATAYLGVNAGLWSGTSAITSIAFASDSSSNFVQYSSATLYGIKSS